MPRFLALGLLAMLCGCASSGAITVGQDVTMAVGQQLALPDASKLRYTGIANDSRCPPAVQCIRAGDADVLFDHTPQGGSTARITLNTERTRTTTIGTWQLRLMDLVGDDAPRATIRLDASNETAAP